MLDWIIAFFGAIIWFILIFLGEGFWFATIGTFLFMGVIYGCIAVLGWLFDRVLDLLGARKHYTAAEHAAKFPRHIEIHESGNELSTTAKVVTGAAIGYGVAKLREKKSAEWREHRCRNYKCGHIEMRPERVQPYACPQCHKHRMFPS